MTDEKTETKVQPAGHPSTAHVLDATGTWCTRCGSDSLEKNCPGGHEHFPRGSGPCSGCSTCWAGTGPRPCCGVADPETMCAETCPRRRAYERLATHACPQCRWIERYDAPPADPTCLMCRAPLVPSKSAEERIAKATGHDLYRLAALYGVPVLLTDTNQIVQQNIAAKTASIRAEHNPNATRYMASFAGISFPTIAMTEHIRNEPGAMREHSITLTVPSGFSGRTLATLIEMFERGGSDDLIIPARRTIRARCTAWDETRWGETRFVFVEDAEEEDRGALLSDVPMPDHAAAERIAKSKLAQDRGRVGVGVHVDLGRHAAAAVSFAPVIAAAERARAVVSREVEKVAAATLGVPVSYVTCVKRGRGLLLYFDGCYGFPLAAQDEIGEALERADLLPDGWTLDVEWSQMPYLRCLAIAIESALSWQALGALAEAVAAVVQSELWVSREVERLLAEDAAEHPQPTWLVPVMRRTILAILEGAPPFAPRECYTLGTIEEILVDLRQHELRRDTAAERSRWFDSARPPRIDVYERFRAEALGEPESLRKPKAFASAGRRHALATLSGEQSITEAFGAPRVPSEVMYKFSVVGAGEVSANLEAVRDAAERARGTGGTVNGGTITLGGER